MILSHGPCGPLHHPEEPAQLLSLVECRIAQLDRGHGRAHGFDFGTRIPPRPNLIDVVDPGIEDQREVGSPELLEHDLHRAIDLPGDPDACDEEQDRKGHDGTDQEGLPLPPTKVVQGHEANATHDGLLRCRGPERLISAPPPATITIPGTPANRAPPLRDPRRTSRNLPGDTPPAPRRLACTGSGRRYTPP